MWQKAKGSILAESSKFASFDFQILVDELLASAGQPMFLHQRNSHFCGSFVLGIPLRHRYLEDRPIIVAENMRLLMNPLSFHDFPI